MAAASQPHASPSPGAPEPGDQGPVCALPEASGASDLALVMSGGGARAAYQVGILRYLVRRYPELELPIVTGVSAGAINAAYLASRPEPLPRRVELLAELWRDLEADRVFDVGTLGLLGKVLAWGLRLVSGGLIRSGDLRGMVDTAPLRRLLYEALQTKDGVLRGIDHNLRESGLRAVALTTASYTTGQSITWVQGCEIPHWERAGRRSRPTVLTVEHIMASAALPLFFPAVGIDGAWYGDGGMRLVAPLSPAVHLGARRILAISTRYAKTPQEAEVPVVQGYPPPAQVAGVLLNAIFLDQFDGDALRMERINRLLEDLPQKHSGDLQEIELLLLRPSRDLGRLANEYEPRLPRTFRYLTRGMGTKRTSSNDLLSLVMFQPDYLRALLELGEADAEAQAERIEAFLTGAPAGT